MKYIIPAVLLVVLAAGCARFKSEITERTKEGGSKITLVKASTLFESKSDLAKFKALQTDKTQSIGIGSLGQESNATNVVRSLELINAILGKGAMLP